ncbi:MAG: hypothetical protein IPJ34_19665 [Myxococcales bacterium]|nr:hypothetical protein [Myxococcales bacterium]
MSYDLVFWKGSPSSKPAAVFQALSEGQPVEDLVPLGIDEIARAFELEFGARVRFDEGRLSGPAFDVSVADDGRHFTVCAGWSVVRDTASRKVLAQLRSVATRLGCHTFNPQLEVALPAPSPRSVPAPSDELEARVRLTDAAEDWALYAAELRAKGDPRGALIDLQGELMAIYRAAGFPLPKDAATNALRARVDEAEKPVEAQRAAAQAGILSDWIAQRHVELRADRGFVHSATVRAKVEPVLRTWPRIVGVLLRNDTTRLLRSLEVVAPGSFDEVCQDGLQAIAAAPFADSLRTLTMETHHLGALGDLGPMLAAASELRRLTLTVESVLLRPFRHAKLESLELCTVVLDDDDVTALATSELPELRKLTLAPSPYAPGARLPVTGLASLLRKTSSVSRLSLGAYANVPEVVAELRRGERFCELTELRLEDADESVARLLLDAGASLGALETLVLGAASGCSVETARELERVFGARLSMRHARAERPAEARPKPQPPAPPAVVMPARPPRAALPEVEEIEEGARVRHAKFGPGVVTELADDRAAVRFDDGTVRRLALAFLRPDA